MSPYLRIGEVQVAYASRPTFGKYRGKAVSDVAERDPGYLRWLFNNLDSMSPELRLTLKHYLENT